MKKGLVGLLTVVVLVLASYYVTGMMVESHMREDLALLNQTPNVQVDLENYKRGLFSSKGNITVSLHVPEREVVRNGRKVTQPSKDYTHATPLTIYHGPFIFPANGSPKFGVGFAQAKIELPKDITEKMSKAVEVSGDMPALDLSFFLGYFSDSKLKLVVNPFQMKSKDDKGEFKWMGLNSEFYLSSGGKAVQGDTVIDGMNFNSSMFNASVGKLQTSYDVAQNDQGLWLGKADFSFPSMKMTQNDKEKLALVDFKGHSLASVDNGLFTQTTNFSLNKLAVDGKQFGPGNINLVIRNLDAKVLAEINQKVNEMNNATEKEAQMMMFSLLPKLSSLVSKGAEVEISDMYLVMPQGKVEASAKVSVPEGPIDNPMMLMGKVQANAKLRVPVALVKGTMQNIIEKKMLHRKHMQQVLAEQMQQQNANAPEGSSDAAKPVELSPQQIRAQAQAQVEQQLGRMVQIGMLVVDGDYYSLAFNYQNAQLTINGKPFNPAMLR